MAQVGWWTIVQGCYYAISVTNILSSWGGREDWCERRDPERILVKSRHVDDLRWAGLLGFQAGLYVDQQVPRDTWETRVPYEFHIRRHLFDQPADRQRREGTVMAPSPSTEGFDAVLEIQWFDHNFWRRPISPKKVFDIRFAADFREVTFQMIQPFNQPNQASINLRGGMPGNEQPITVNMQEKAEGHPFVFDIISLEEISLGTFVNPYEHDFLLGVSVSLKPKYTEDTRGLRAFLNPVNPDAVVLDLRTSSLAPEHWQHLNYDIFH